MKALTLLMLPGFDGTGKLFAPILTELGSEFSTSVVRFADEVEFGDYVATAAAKLERDTILVAESFSGPVAIELMRRHPERIRGAVLCATFARSPFRQLTMLARFAPRGMFEASALREPMLRHFCLDDGSLSLLPGALGVARSIPALTVKRRLVVLSQIDMRATCSGLRAPILLLRATRDRIVSVHRHRELASVLPHAKTQDIDGPHLLLQTRPRECASAIRDFASESASTPMVRTQ